MNMATNDRHYELILFGATGYTGRLTAEHIATHLPSDLRWAVSGRSSAKLEALVGEIKSLNPDRSQPGTSGYESIRKTIRVLTCRALSSSYRDRSAERA